MEKPHRFRTYHPADRLCRVNPVNGTKGARGTAQTGHIRNNAAAPD
jgi:hypothetical protein